MNEEERHTMVESVKWVDQVLTGDTPPLPPHSRCSQVAPLLCCSHCCGAASRLVISVIFNTLASCMSCYPDPSEELNMARVWSDLGPLETVCQLSIALMGRLDPELCWPLRMLHRCNALT